MIMPDLDIRILGLAFSYTENKWKYAVFPANFYFSKIQDGKAYNIFSK
jgi:hypothetical protein